MGIQRFVAGVEYLGTHFSGFQAQNNPPVRTVEASLNAAFSKIANEPIRVVGAGRTDAGVHAHEQVIHFDTTAVRRDLSWLRGVNHYLPKDCVVKWIKPVDQDFHARFSAKSRFYYYHIWHSAFPSALHLYTKTWEFRELDLSRMQAAANILIGEHNFNAFRSSECQARNPVRIMHHLNIQQYDNEFVILAHANGFLHNMVRNIVGALVEIGCGKHEVSWMEEVLLSQDRQKSARKANPEGLFFAGVEYDEKWGIPFDFPRL